MMKMIWPEAKMPDIFINTAIWHQIVWDRNNINAITVTRVKQLLNSGPRDKLQWVVRISLGISIICLQCGLIQINPMFSNFLTMKQRNFQQVATLCYEIYAVTLKCLTKLLMANDFTGLLLKVYEIENCWTVITKVTIYAYKNISNIYIPLLHILKSLFSNNKIVYCVSTV